MRRSFRHSRQLIVLLSSIAIIASMAGQPIRAIDDNLTKGATNNHVFEAGMWGENIDNLNGGLNLTIPIGPEFRVSPDLSYQLTLTYSSKLWAMTSANLNERMDSRLAGHGQAGLGFNLQFGRRYEHAGSPDCQANEMVFEDATGAAHPLGLTPSPDGSYLKTLFPNKILRPDGVTLTLGPEVPDLRPESLWFEDCEDDIDPNVDAHTNSYRGEYVTKMAGKDLDASGNPVNWVNIQYETQVGKRHLISSVTDSQGRTITFVNDFIGNIGLVKSVTMPAFGGNATYVFTYEDQAAPEEIGDLFYAISGSAVLDPNHQNGFGQPIPITFDVALLKSITFPHGYSMQFEYSDPDEYCASSNPNEPCQDNYGLLQARILPTGARIEYDYELYTFQHNRCTIRSVPGNCVNPTMGGGIVADSCWLPNPTYQGVCNTSDFPGTVALREKRVEPAPNQPPYKWTWERRPYTTFVVNGSPKALSNPYKVVMRDPYGNDTATLYWAQASSRDPAVAAQNDNEPWWRNGLVGATKYYRGSSANPLNLVRTEVQVWEDRLESTAPNHAGNYKRIKETQTIYHDNAGATSRTENSDWDGFGHYRTVTQYGFDGTPYRKQRTGYNCDTVQGNVCVPRVAHVGDQSSPGNWVLDTYSFTETLDPNGQVLQRSEYQFDDLGYLKVQRDLLTLPATPGGAFVAGNVAAASAGDIVTEYCYEGESSCGAPAGPRTGNVYSRTLNDNVASTHSESYTYVGPYLASRQIDGIAWLSEDKDIDAQTGLTSVSRDPSGIATAFDYDLLGRLTMVTPVSVGGVEQPAELSYPDIHTTELKQSASPSNFIFSRFSFDGLGRLERVEKRQSNGTLARQTTRYNEAGRMTFQSEWFDPNQVADPNNPPGTTYDYKDPFSDPNNPSDDPFGRVRKTTTADSRVTRTNYAGLSSSVIVEGVKGRCGGDIEAATSYEKDAFGRLTQVISARGADDGDCGPTARRDGADAEYTYDRLDRMTRVRLEGEDQDSATIAQLRHFSYDALGRRLSETNPENGAVTYGSYDVLGNVLQKQDAAGRVFVYGYDLASRLTSVSRVGSTGSLMTMTYDQAGFGYSAGKLTTVVSNDDSGQALVKEERRYDGLNGRLSERKWRIRSWDPTKTFNQQPWVTMGYVHDSLGLLHDLTYPEDPNVARQFAHPTYYYANGHLTSATDLVRGMLVESVGYNPAGGVELIRTRGGVETLIVPDDRNRPASITVTGPPAPYCGDGTCSTAESCESCVPDCGQCPGGGEGPGGECPPGQICQQGQAWIPSARRPIGQSPATLFTSGTYEYDGAGNISRMGFDHYRYDTLNRLVMAEIVTPASNIENVFWSYDAFGNMLTQRREDAAPNSWSILHHFTVDSQKNQIEEYSANGAMRQAAYGDTGAMTADGVHEYVYDLRDRLLDVYEEVPSGPLTARYTYDHEGYRLSKYDGATGTTTFYLRDLDGRVLSEFRRPADGQAKPIWSKDYIYAAGRHVAMIENDRPAPPGGIDVSTNSYGQSPNFVTLGWEPVGDTDLLQYQIFRKDAAGNEQMFVHQNLTNTTWTDSDPSLQQGQAYTYRITAMDQAANESERSEPVVVTPGDNATPGTPVLMLPTSGDQWVNLKWSKPSSPDVWSYRLFRRESTDWVQLGGDFRVLEVTDRTVANGTTYFYQVKAVDTAGLVSPASNEQPASPNDNAPPSPPQGLVAIPGTTQVELSWQPSVSQDATGNYRVYRSTTPVTDPNGPFSIVTGTALLDSVSALTTYYYRVRTIDDDGNLSSFSAEVVAHTKDPAVGVPQFTGQEWDYCRSSSCCLPHNSDCDLSPILFIPRIASRKNFVMTHAPWTAQGSEELEELRLYRRRFSSDPFDLAATLPKPGPVEYPLVRFTDWETWQFAFNPADACAGWEYRVSAVSETGAESALSVPRVMLPQLLIPENLTVPAEPLPRDPEGFRRQDLVTELEDPAMYGLTLEWSAVNSSCSAGFSGYHVYRSRRQKNYNFPSDALPPIRLTRAPVGIPQYRVQYMSTINWDVIPHPLFYGEMGRQLTSNSSGPTYSVTSVDMLGNESSPSSGVRAQTNSEFVTVPGDTANTVDNYEVSVGLPAISLLNAQMDGPGTIGSLSWQWRYGHGGVPNMVSGPSAGNWALMTWGEISQGYPNEIQISRQVGTDPNYYIMDLAPIPGDDLGVREFVWHIDPNLACQDAHYKVRGVDLVNPPGPWSDPLAVLKHTLIPENPSIELSASAPRVTVTWDELPSCAGRLLGYKVFRADATTGCSSAMPLDSNFALLSTQTIPAGTEQYSYTPTSTSAEYWYRVKAIWSADGGATIETAMSAGVCSSAEKGPAPPKAWAIAQGFLGFPNWDASTCNNNCMGVVWDPPGQPVGPILGYDIYRSAPVGQCDQTMPSTGYTKINEDLVPNTDTSWQYNAPPTGWYWFRVKAVYPGGESELSPQGDCASWEVSFSENKRPVKSSPEAEWRQAKLTPNPSSLAEISQSATMPEEEVRLTEDLVPSSYRAIGQGSANPPVRMSFYHLDHLGTPRVITDVAGQPISKHKYLPFGEELNPPPSSNSHKFTGHERDKETGLDYMLARYYSPAGTFRFASVDPASESAISENPQSWNRYTYAANNPLKYLDPDGRDIELSSKGNGSAAKSMLIETAMRPTGRADLQRIDSDHSITVTVQDSRINTTQTLQQVAQTGGTLTTETVSLEGQSLDAQGNVKHQDVSMKLDTKAIEQAHPDPSGVTSTAHGLYHVEGHRQGQTNAQIKAGDKPTPSTGPAAAHGQSVANEKPDISRKEAKKFVKEMLKK